MTPTGNRLRNHRATFALAVCAALVLASALPLTVASCRTQTVPPDEPAAYERLRLLTRGGAAPAGPPLLDVAPGAAAHAARRTLQGLAHRLARAARTRARALRGARLRGRGRASAHDEF